MSLEDYDRKRDFAQTAEPGPALKSSPAGDLFVIQKHAARRLHYDVRLELDGTLKSWAVPRGPSLDPQDKHLAVHVEDHPLDYAGFEGTIPKGQYGAGTVMVWDRGRWFPEGEAVKDPAAAYREGKLKFRLEGEKLHGGWMLLRLKPRPGDHAENWLLFKERDDEAREGADAAITIARPDSVLSGRSLEQIAADAEAGTGGGGSQAASAAPVDLAEMPGARAAPLPARLAPQLATLVAEAPTGDDWLHEIKYDGYRVMCRLEEGKARLLTRRGADWTSHFPSLLGAVERIPARSAILDGEVVFVQPDGRTSFPKLASALQSGADEEGGIVYYVFDLIYLDGYDLTGVPLFRAQGGAAPVAGWVSAGRPGAVCGACAGPREGVLQRDLRTRPRGGDRQAPRRPVPAGPRARLAQGQVHPPPGVRDRRVHGARRRPRRYRRAASGSPRGGRRPVALRRPRRYGLGRADDDRTARPARRAPAGGRAVRRPP